MTMNQDRVGIEMLTLLGMPPVEYINLASKLGCREVSSGLTGLPLSMFGIDDFAPWPMWSLRDEPKLRTELKAAMRDTGVLIGLAEGFRTSPSNDVADYSSDLDLFAELGALRVNAIGLEPDLARSNDQLAQLCDMTMERGMTFTVEFCPAHAVGTLQDVQALIDHIGGGKAKFLIDSMHFFRTGGTVSQIEALDPSTIGYVQLADCRTSLSDDEYMAAAMFAREVPGMGELPLKEFIAALPADVTISVEVPRLDDLRGGMPAEMHAERCVAAARALGA